MNPDSSPQIPTKITFGEILKEILVFAGMVFIIFFVIRPYIVEPYVVDGASMYPTFKTGNYLLVDKLSYEIGKPKRNSVLVFKYPNDQSKSFIKRIIGLPGETLVMKNNVLTITNAENPNGFTPDQSYVVNQCQHTGGACVSSFEKTLARDEYFVMGDNRAESFDSRSWGPLPKKDILGKPFVRLWPLTKISILPGNVR